MSGARSVTILGATGSVGTSTLDVIAQSQGRLSVDTVTAYGNAEQLAELASKHGARHAVVGDPEAHQTLKAALGGTGITVAAGEHALREAASRPVDVVLSAIVGAAGLAPTVAAIQTQSAVALANKETLVTAGRFVMEEAKRCNTVLLPVDSEHSALLQALGGPQHYAERDLSHVAKLVITASGGPFRERISSSLETVTPEEAVAHPTWSMGAKISVDSATLMNKALELIEAKHLFGVSGDMLDTVVHQQSIIHGYVQFKDGSVIAQLGSPDMRMPIGYALEWPKRAMVQLEPLDLAEIGALTFEKPDETRFPALALARAIIGSDSAAATICNAANEIAVEAFLDHRLPFTQIVRAAEDAVGHFGAFEMAAPGSLEEAMDMDGEARAWTQRHLGQNTALSA